MESKAMPFIRINIVALVVALMGLMGDSAGPLWAQNIPDQATSPGTKQETHRDPETKPFPVPEGYTVKILNPVGARIACPQDWFFAEGYDPSGLTWILSREDVAQGPYRTGMRIQLLQGIAEQTKTTPEDFIRNFIEEKKKVAGKIAEECEERMFQSFHRRCLDIEEVLDLGQGRENFHVTYSLFWNNATDTAITMIFGAPVEEWAQVRSIAANMGMLELPDISQMILDAAETMRTGCVPGLQESSKDLHQYLEAGGEAKSGLFTIGGIGNENFVLEPDKIAPIPVSQFASMIKSDDSYTPAVKIVLLWPYSAAGQATFLHELHSLLGNEVVGVDGPLWIYPDGTFVVTDARLGVQRPDSANITECIKGDGTILAPGDCVELALTLDHSRAVYGNSPYAPESCDELGKMAVGALLGDARDAFELYLYYSLVNMDREKASLYLKLVAGRNRLADPFVTPQDQK